MHNWAIVNRFTAQKFIILQILCYQKSRTVFCEPQATHINESWWRERGEITFYLCDRAERSFNNIKKKDS